MEITMKLTPEQEAILNGSKGEAMAKVMRTLVEYGQIYGATKMVPVTGECGHLVLSFGLMFLGPVFDLYQQLIDEGCLPQQKLTCDPLPYDKNVPQTRSPRSWRRSSIRSRVPTTSS